MAATVLRVDPNASMQAIADASAFARLTVYRHFPTRDDLMDTLRTTSMGVILDAMKSALDSTENAVEALEAAALAIAAAFRTLPPPSVIFPKSFAPDNLPPFSVELDQIFADIVKRGVRDGTLRKELDPRILRYVTLGGLEAWIGYAILEERDPVLACVDIVNLVVNGARG